MVAVQALEKRTAELKQKEAQIAVPASKVEELEAKQAYLRLWRRSLEALELRANSSIQLTAEKSLGAGGKQAQTNMHGPLHFGNSTMAQWAVVLLVAVVLAGCATSREIYTADGRRVYSIECRAIFYQSFDCIEKAQELCGEKGFTILEKSGEPTTAFAKNMIIQCR